MIGFEDQAIGALSHQESQSGAGPFAWRQRRCRSNDMVSDQAELGQQRPSIGNREAGSGHELVQHGPIGGKSKPGLFDLADDHSGTYPTGSSIQRDPSEQRLQKGGLAGTVGAGDGDPVTESDLEIDRTELEITLRDDRPRQPANNAPTALAHRYLQAKLPGFPGLLDHLEPFHRLLGSRRSTGELFGLVDLERLDVLVVVRRLFLGLRRPLRGPLPLPLGPPSQGRSPNVVPLEPLPGLLTGSFPFLAIGGPTAGEPRRPMSELVEFEDIGDGAFEKRPVVADQGGRCGEPG